MCAHEVDGEVCSNSNFSLRFYLLAQTYIQTYIQVATAVSDGVGKYTKRSCGTMSETGIYMHRS